MIDIAKEVKNYRTLSMTTLWMEKVLRCCDVSDGRIRDG